MASKKLVWDQTGARKYETGVDRGVLYPQVDGLYPKGVAWNGLTSVTESPSGAEASPVYADNIKFLNLYSVEEFGATVEALTYPDEFEACDGSVDLVAGVSIGQQDRQAFGMSYRTRIGNDVKGDKFGYKIHIIYGAKASPTEKSHNTVNDSPEASTMSWTLTTTPVEVEGMNPTATLVIDSTKIDEAKLAKIENILYGSEGAEARLPLPNEIVEIINSAV